MRQGRTRQCSEFMGVSLPCQALRGFRRVMGYEDIWMLEAVLDERAKDKQLAREAVAG